MVPLETGDWGEAGLPPRQCLTVTVELLWRWEFALYCNSATCRLGS